MSDRPSGEWVPYDPDDKGANPLPIRNELVWIHDRYYHGVTFGRWDGWWIHHTGSDDLGVSHWMPLTKPKGPEGETPGF